MVPAGCLRADTVLAAVAANDTAGRGNALGADELVVGLAGLAGVGCPIALTAVVEAALLETVGGGDPGTRRGGDVAADSRGRAGGAVISVAALVVDGVAWLALGAGVAVEGCAAEAVLDLLAALIGGDGGGREEGGAGEGEDADAAEGVTARGGGRTFVGGPFLYGCCNQAVGP